MDLHADIDMVFKAAKIAASKYSFDETDDRVSMVLCAIVELNERGRLTYDESRGTSKLAYYVGVGLNVLRTQLKKSKTQRASGGAEHVPIIDDLHMSEEVDPYDCDEPAGQLRDRIIDRTVPARDRYIASRVMEGQSFAEIARDLGLSRPVISRRLRNAASAYGCDLMRELMVRSPSEAILSDKPISTY